MRKLRKVLNKKPDMASSSSSLSDRPVLSAQRHSYLLLPVGLSQSPAWNRMVDRMGMSQIDFLVVLEFHHEWQGLLCYNLTFSKRSLGIKVMEKQLKKQQQQQQQQHFNARRTVDNLTHSKMGAVK